MGLVMVPGMKRAALCLLAGCLLIFRRMGTSAKFRMAHLAAHSVFRMILGFAIIPLAHAQVDEYIVKGAFLYKFGLFAQWPASAFPSPAAPLYLCIAGADPFGIPLDNLVAGQHINGHPVVIRRLKKVDKNSACHILYAGGSEDQSEADILNAVRGSPVLTVSDNGDANAAVINFVVTDNHVRFDINDEAAAQNGIAISSQLLKLALNVKRRTKEE